MIRILYFARLREELGCASEELPLPEAVTQVGQLVAWLKARDMKWEQALTSNFRVAVNQDMASLTTPLADGDEVALFPPVTGG